MSVMLPPTGIGADYLTNGHDLAVPDLTGTLPNFTSPSWGSSGGQTLLSWLTPQTDATSTAGVTQHPTTPNGPWYTGVGGKIALGGLAIALVLIGVIALIFHGAAPVAAKAV